MLNTKPKLLTRNYDDLDAKDKKFPLWQTLLFTLVLAAICILASCQPAQADIDISVISRIESSNNPDAFNPYSKARGLCQITPVVLKEFNQMTGRNYLPQDLFIDQVNLLIADWYINERIPQMLSAYKLKDTWLNRIWAYNAGIGRVKQHVMPLETKNYIKKYKSIEGRM